MDVLVFLASMFHCSSLEPINFKDTVRELDHLAHIAGSDVALDDSWRT
jgi:hypothetical protein